jgi:very-short-patch-repair endonuclease
LKIYYNPKLKEYARELRKNATFSERLLWKYLRAGQLNGYRFLRQKPIDEFIIVNKTSPYPPFKGGIKSCPPMK